MNKKEINLIGGGFKHCLSTNGYILPKKIKWVLDNSSNTSIHVDEAIFFDTNKNKRNFAFISESKTIIPNVYNRVLQDLNFLEEKYELIFTHDIFFKNKSKKIKIIDFPCTSWILEQDRKLYDKSKLISMIASNKIICAEHILRNKVANSVQNQVDLYGRGRNPINDKLDGLKDYCFSIAMENGNYDNMFSEKILDCFTTAAVPIYYGSRCILKLFNPEGIIWLDEVSLNTLSFDVYHSKKLAIEENFEIACNLPFPEDFIFENFIKE